MIRRTGSWLALVAAAILASQAAIAAEPPPVGAARLQQPLNPPLPDHAAMGVPDRLKPIDQVVLPTPRMERMPRDYAAELFAKTPADHSYPGSSRPWSYFTRTYESTALCYRPLYFEDATLERYGVSHGVAQPAVSAARFGAQMAALPYSVVRFPPHRCYYTVGDHRPGDCPP